VSRRGMLIVVAVALVVLGVSLFLNAQKERDRPSIDEPAEGVVDSQGKLVRKKLQPAGAKVRDFFGPNLTNGSKLGPGKLVEVYDIQTGRIKVTLNAGDGPDFDVDILRSEPGLTGVGNSRTLSIYLGNGGNGSKQTNEAQGQVIMALASELGTRETAGFKLDGLSTLSERRSKQNGSEIRDGGTSTTSNSDGGR